MQPPAVPVSADAGGNATVPLGQDGSVPQAAEAQAFLIREKTGARIAITGPEFLVGSGAGSVAYLIEDNAAISRRHVLFTLRDKRWVIADQNSLNKTYLNGRLLTPFEEVVLTDGDQLRLANEMFRFAAELPAAAPPPPPADGTVKLDQGG